jgi:hypothetical protein
MRSASEASTCVILPLVTSVMILSRSGSVAGLGRR